MISGLKNAFNQAGQALASATQQALNAGYGALANGIRDELKALPKDQRFNKIKESITQIRPETKELFDKIKQADLGDELAHAITHNDHFLDYIIEQSINSGSAENGNFLDETIQSLFTDDNGNPLGKGQNGEQLINVQNAGFVKDILTNIGNNPTEDFSDELEVVAKNIEAYDIAKSSGDPEKEKEALDLMVRSLRAAGANVSAFATADKETFTGFMNAFLGPGGSADRAMNFLISDLEMSAEQAAALQAQLGPILKLLGPMLEPYAELWQKHGDDIIGGIYEMGSDAQTIMGGRKTQLSDEDISFQRTLGEKATTGGMSAEEFREKFNELSRENPAANLNDVLNRMVEINPALKDEAAAIKSDIQLTSSFNAKGQNMTAEQLQEFGQTLANNLNNDNTVREAMQKTVNSTFAPGG